MRPWIKPFIAGSFFSIALLGGVAAYAVNEVAPGAISAMHHHDGKEHEAMFRAMVVKHLDLDAAQTTRLDGLIAQMHAQHQAMHGSGDFHSQLLPLVQANAFDRTAAQTLVDAKLTQVRDAAPQVIAAFADFYDALRPEQQQKVRDFMASHHEHGEHHG